MHPSPGLFLEHRGGLVGTWPRCGMADDRLFEKDGIHDVILSHLTMSLKRWYAMRRDSHSFFHQLHPGKVRCWVPVAILFDPSGVVGGKMNGGVAFWFPVVSLRLTIG